MTFLFPRNLRTINASFRSPTGATGIFHIFGYMEAPAAEAALTQASTTQTMGSANNAYGAAAFICAKAAGTASGGSGAVTIVVSGTSITTAGVRTAGDSEVICADITTLATNAYLETTKYWIGQITYTLTVGATGHTAYAASFNYGFISDQPFGNQSVVINQIEYTGRAGGNDTGFNFQLLKHTGSGDTHWTYSAAAFVPGGEVLWDMATEYNTEKNLVSGKRFHYHRKGLNTVINGSTTEGIIGRITVGANNAVESSDCRVFYY